MSKLKCEICGGTDLIKDGGEFLCRGCGMRYSKEEVQKMLSKETDTHDALPIDKAYADLYASEFIEAGKCASRILADDKTNSEAWLVKLLAEYGCRTAGDLKDASLPLDISENWNGLMKYGGPEMTAALTSSNTLIRTRIASAAAVIAMGKEASDPDEYDRAASILKGLPEEELDKLDLPFGFRPVFGSWDGKPIVWRKLASYSGNTLMITEKCLCLFPYNDTYSPVTWESSTLRRWLNGEFFSDAFSPEEQDCIAEVLLMNNDNEKYGASGGNKTSDKVFALSIEEAERLFSDDADRSAQLNGEDCGWWLRSPGYDSAHASAVLFDGDIYSSGNYVNYDRCSARPAVWVNEDKLKDR
ncbi:MAG: hypothetical protein IK026_05300 [Eubacteriaceae bacterium]|nr:hypothetical protein [Eubacteriaceae bacterium]